MSIKYSRYERYSRYRRQRSTAGITGSAVIAPPGDLTLTCQYSGWRGEGVENELDEMEREMETARRSVERFYMKFMM